MAEEEKALNVLAPFKQKVGGDRVETHVPGHGTPGALASAAIAKKRRKKHEATATEIVDGAVKELQTLDNGVYSLVQWAKRNNTTLSDFYTKLFGRRIPSEVAGEGGGPIFIQFKKFEKEESG